MPDQALRTTPFGSDPGPIGSDPGEPAAESRTGILVDHELEALFGSVIQVRPSAESIQPAQLQPASLDLRLGERLASLRCGFLPERASVEERLEDLAIHKEELGPGGVVLRRGAVYLIELEEEIALEPGMVARFNPRSTTGRCDLFCRVLVPGAARFDETPPGYSGRLWLEVVPLSFPVRLSRGDRLVQMRLSLGECALTSDELRSVHAQTPLVFHDGKALPESQVRFDDAGALELRVGLEGREPCGWRAADHTPVVQFNGDGVHEAREFFEPVYSTPRGRVPSTILDPSRFSIFASRERLRIPPGLAAEMLPVDVSFGELRNNYAGFFDPGFGWKTSADGSLEQDGTPAVLEVRAHDVPFLVEDGQVFFRLRFFHTTGAPRNLYGQGRPGRSYRGQDLTLARPFQDPGSPQP